MVEFEKYENHRAFQKNLYRIYLNYEVTWLSQRATFQEEAISLLLE
jgi:hypothetical protein